MIVRSRKYNHQGIITRCAHQVKAPAWRHYPNSLRLPLHCRRRRVFHLHPVLAADLVVDGDGTRDRQKRAYARRNCLYGEVSDLKIPERAAHIPQTPRGVPGEKSASPLPTFTSPASGRPPRSPQPPPSPENKAAV